MILSRIELSCILLLLMVLNTNRSPLPLTRVKIRHKVQKFPRNGIYGYAEKEVSQTKDICDPPNCKREAEPSLSFPSRSQVRPFFVMQFRSNVFLFDSMSDSIDATDQVSKKISNVSTSCRHHKYPISYRYRYRPVVSFISNLPLTSLLVLQFC